MPSLPLPRFTRSDLLCSVSFDPRWPAIGPHERRAAWLMHQGWKPAAYFCDIESFILDSEASSLVTLVDAGIVEKHVRPFPAKAPHRYPSDLHEIIYVLPEKRDLVAALRRCADEWAGAAPDIGYQREKTFARALGYGTDDIQAFIWRAYG